MSRPRYPAHTFILGDVAGRPTIDEKVRVRSQCMRGRNKRHDSRRSLRETRRLNGKKAAVRSQSDTASSENSLSTFSSTNTSHGTECRAVERETALSGQLPKPRACPHDMALMRFAESLEDRSNDLLFKSMSCGDIILPASH